MTPGKKPTFANVAQAKHARDVTMPLADLVTLTASAHAAAVAKLAAAELQLRDLRAEAEALASQLARVQAQHAAALAAAPEA